MQNKLTDLFKIPQLEISNLDRAVSHTIIGTTPQGVSARAYRYTKSSTAEDLAFDQIEALKFEHCLNLDLEAIFTKLTEMPHLRKLAFKNCEINRISPVIGGLECLTHLSLGVDYYTHAYNKFSEFPPEFGELEHLRELDLCDNRDFKKFPPEVSKLIRLTLLNLRGLPTLPENTEMIPNLKKLQLYKSQIKPEHIEPLVAKPNGLEAVTVSEYDRERFQNLVERYPNFKVFSESEGSLMRGNYL